MEMDFKLPRLEQYYILKQGDKEALRSTLLQSQNLFLYKKCISEGLLENNESDLHAIETQLKSKIHSLEEKKQSDLENESYIFEIDKSICEVYAQACNISEFRAKAAEIMNKDPSGALKLDILMCKIRIAILFENRADLVEFVDEAKTVFECSSDWDRKNRFRVYLGLYHLIKAEFREAADHFSSSLSSFDATELIPFSKLIFYYVFSALLSFNRSELKEKVIENSEVEKYSEYQQLPQAIFNCNYPNMLKELLLYVEKCEDDIFLFTFKEHFCKEMKIKMYYQLLMSYQSLHLTKMAEFFNIEVLHIEDDLRNFINEKRLFCVIDRIDGIVRMKIAKKEDEAQQFFKIGESVLRNIKKSIN